MSNDHLHTELVPASNNHSPGGVVTLRFNYISVISLKCNTSKLRITTVICNDLLHALPFTK